jgi:hypothetical protein
VVQRDAKRLNSWALRIIVRGAGRFVVKRRTDHLRLTRKLKELRIEARRRMHTSIVLQHRWLCSVLRRHFVYFGLPSNFDRINAFYRETCRLWYWALNRRSQRRFLWERYLRLLERFPRQLPTSLILDRWSRADLGKPQEEPSAGKPPARMCVQRRLARLAGVSPRRQEPVAS